MERRKDTAAVLILTFLCMLFGLGCTVIGIFGEGWWIENLEQNAGRIEHGVSRFCKKLKDSENECGYIKNIFRFVRDKDGGLFGDHRDVVLLCLTTGACFEVLAFLPFVVACCMVVTTWECATLLNSLFISLGAVSCITGMTYTEVKYKDTWKSLNSDRTKCWSYIVAWTGTILLVISAIFSFISIFLKPRKHYKMGGLSSPVSGRRKGVPIARSPLASQKSNLGFRKEEHPSNQLAQKSHLKKTKLKPIPESCL